MPLAILGAMPEEIAHLAPLMRGTTFTRRAGREFIAGTLGSTPVTVAFSRWGKVAAASTATELILDHGADRIVFSGTAGALDAELRIGDVVIARHLYQHDLDASPFFRPTEVPLLGISALPTDQEMSRDLLAAAKRFLLRDLAAALASIPGAPDLTHRRVVRADIASGDQVITDSASRQRILRRTPSAAAVEMEGAAVAQVCHEHGVPFACIRTISDSADEHAQASLGAFLGGLAAAYTAGIIGQWLGVPGR